MNFSRCLAAVVSLLILSFTAAHADLFRVDISTRTYSLNGKGEVTFRAGNQRQIIDLAVESDTSANLDAKTLVLAYDTVADALEVVRKSDGTVISTYMSFSDGLSVTNAGQTRSYRQAFITLPGSNSFNGSVDGPIRISYDGKDNITAYRWDGDFQYSVPGNEHTLDTVVHGRFRVERDVGVKAIP
jgi:hypothetical protein